MPVLRTVARPMLASIFAIQGYQTLLQPERVSPVAEPVVRPIAERVPAVPDETTQAVRINGAVQLAAGSLLALGRWPRLSALAIAATLVPTTLAGHRFWEAEDEQERAQQRIHFLKNLSMLGGLLIAAVDTAGRPSLAWRSRHAVHAANRDVSRAAKAAKASAQTAKSSGITAAKASGKTAKVAAKASRESARNAAKVPAKTARTAAKASRKTAAKVPGGLWRSS
ncbi:MAG: DoxX family protein [Micromonosporaceae bacterium]